MTYIMSKTIASIIGLIIFTGFVAGVFSGTAVKTGYDVEPNSLMVKTLGIFCDAVKDVSEAYNTCRSTFVMLTILVFIIGIVEVVTTASQIGNLYVGIGLYAIGWVAGFLLIILN